MGINPCSGGRQVKGSRRAMVLLSLSSLLWLLARSGTRPSRLAYPCQQVALTGVKLLIPGSFLVALYALAQRLRRASVPFLRQTWIALVLLLVLVCGVVSVSSWRLVSQLPSGPVGVRLAEDQGRGSFAAPPGARGLGSPHRVVSVRDPEATSWDFSCTGYGACPSYYGDDAFVDQSIVDAMVAEGLRRLTGKASVSAAWQVLLPAYTGGETVLLKLNFNDSIMGGGVSGYGDNDAYVDALPQIVNSLVDGLLDFGFLENEIWLFDGSRYITDRFRARLHYSNLLFYDRFGNGAEVQATTFLENEGVDFTSSGYSGSTHEIADPLVLADYLVNIPIMKRHGGAGITLALKNHLGSVNGFVSGGHGMHEYFYLLGASYSSDRNPIVDINANAHIMNKTVLVVGDALYAATPDNNEPPVRWQSFGSDSPNMLFFAADPVAADSVMTDYLRREESFSASANDILLVAALAGLGVYEHWNNDDDRDYQVIDYVEIDLESQIFLDGFESGGPDLWSSGQFLVTAS